MIQLKKNILKPEGIELAHDLWENWGIKDSFERKYFIFLIISNKG